MITLTGMQQQAAAAEKRRKQHEGRVREREPLTAAHAVAEGEQQAMEAEQGARKAITAEPGPGTFSEPARPPDPQDFRRPYLDSGHAAPSPQQAPPNQSPMPPQTPGVLYPLHPGSGLVVTGHAGPAMQGIAAHQARVR